MIIEIEKPVFKCEDDQAIFLGRLSSLPGYDHVIGKEQTLKMTINGHSEKAMLEELQEICHIWNTTFKVVNR